MNKTQLSAIRVSRTNEVNQSLVRAKKFYPTLSDPEILKLGLSRIMQDITEETERLQDRIDIMNVAARSVGHDYLSDPDEDIYTEDMGKKVNFS